MSPTGPGLVLGCSVVRCLLSETGVAIYLADRALASVLVDQAGGRIGKRVGDNNGEFEETFESDHMVAKRGVGVADQQTSVLAPLAPRFAPPRSDTFFDDDVAPLAVRCAVVEKENSNKSNLGS